MDQNQTEDSDFDDDSFSSSSRSSLVSNAPSVQHFNISVCHLSYNSCTLVAIIPLFLIKFYALKANQSVDFPSFSHSLSLCTFTVHIQEDISWAWGSQGLSLNAFHTQSGLHVLTEVDLQHPTLHHWHHSCLLVGSDQRSHCIPPGLGPLSSDEGQLGCHKGHTTTHPGSSEPDIEGVCRRLWWRGVQLAIFSWRRVTEGSRIPTEIGSIETTDT